MAVQLPDFSKLGFNDPQATGRLPQYPENDPLAVGEAALGKGISEAGKGLEDFAADIERKRQRLNESTATLDLFTRLVPLQTKIAQETDTDKIAEYRQEINNLLPTSAQAIDDPLRQKMWMATHGKTILEANSHADTRTTLLYRNKSLASANELLDRAVKTAVGSDDPMAFAVAQKGIADHLDWEEKNGNLLPEQRYEKQKLLNKQLVEGRVLTLLGQERAGEAKTFLDQHGGDLDPITRGNFQLRIEHAAEKQGIKSDIAAEVGGYDKGYAGDRGAASRTGAPDQMDNWETRNFNFGGLRKVGVPAAGPNAGGFQSFASADEGVAAISNQLDRYASGATTGQPLTTIRQIVSTWAPPSENPTDELIARAAKVTGFDPDQALNVGDPAIKAKLIEATIRNEQGGKLPVDPAIITKVAGGETGGAAQASGGMAPLFDIDASRQRIQARADRGEITQDRANAVIAGVNGWFHGVQASQANARGALTKRLNDGAAMLADGRDFEYDPMEIRHFYPKEKADEWMQILQDNKDAGQVTAGVRLASPADLEQQRQQFTTGMDDPNATDYARRRKRLGDFDKAEKDSSAALGRDLTKPGGDPAGYVAQYSPTVAAKFAAIDKTKPETFADYANAALSEQRRLGVPEERLSILPASVAANVAARIGAIDPAKEDPAKVVGSLAKSYGDYWPQAYGDLVNAKLPGTYQVLAVMDRPEQTVAAADLTRAIGLVAEKGGMSALKKAVPDATQKAIDKGLDDSLADFRDSVGLQSGGARLYATVRDASQALAYYYGFRGQSDSEAVRSAVDGIINAKYDFDTIGAKLVRMPKGMKGDVDRAASVVQNGVSADQLGEIPGNPILSPQQRKDIWLGAIQQGGWANNEDDSGLVLMGKFRNGAYGAVRRADGSRIELKFADAAALAKTAPPEPIDWYPRAE